MSLSDPLSEVDDFLNDDVNPDVEMDTGFVFTRLNEVVRKQYFGFLENLLKENYMAWRQDALNQIQPQNLIQACAQLLEDKAVKACMMVQIYRKTMIKIIASVRRSTKQCRLQHQLRMFIEGETTPKTIIPNESKSTQTINLITKNKRIQTHSITITNNDDFTSPSLQRKIEKFQEKLNKETASMVAAVKPQTKFKLVPVRRKRKLRAPDVAAPTTPQSPSFYLHSPQVDSTVVVQSNINQKKCNELKECPNINDEVALELAQLFSEEKSEIDKIFGFDSNEEPDDPQINSILKEIENAKLPHEKNVGEQDVQVHLTSSKQNTMPVSLDYKPNDKVERNRDPISKSIADMRNSLWPCELFMQRRRLSEALSRLIEEDFRWNEIMKWKFVTLFGEDSEDEFASYSPTIELDETLMCSCVKRISPWVVKHLMKPMNDGLIANRFLFKKLAKKLSRDIILENQYPDERMIKAAVENFFCIRQAVVTLDDLDIPLTLYNENL